MKAIGKITRDDYCTHSLVPYLFDAGHFKTKQEVLNDCIRARHGESIRTPQTLRQRTGDVLEKPLIQECMKRLGIDKYEDKVTEKVVHPILPLEGSLDGMAYPEKLTIKEDIENGIHTLDSTEVYLNGNVPIEVKCTSIYPDDVPPDWLGVLQLKAAMSTTQANAGILIILYQSTDLRIYVIPKDYEFEKELEEKVMDFNRRIDEEDYYTPQVTSDAHIKYPNASDETKILPEDTLEFIKQLEQTNDMIKNLGAMKEKLSAHIMDQMGNASVGRTGEYIINWKMRKYKAQPERVVPAKDAYEIRSKTLTIKKNAN
nr:Phage-related protein, predicted endonuclease [uncultured Mediterranean phage uvMED]BAR29211.1 Phage-related protein, predicted endonuclease [uncultured Mediterranean phage uvMED]|tara:strand:- start:527 stop:1471 length:945 start_codon:yes stop_codon:yes gene_type:complete